MSQLSALLLLLLLLLCGRASTYCEQKWDDVKAPHHVANSYFIYLYKINTTDEHKLFLPSTKYQVAIKPEDEDMRFIRFFLTADNENKSLPSGTMELVDEETTQFSQDCEDAVAQRSQVAKDQALVYWTAPPEGSGCVIFRATVMESQFRWFMDGTLEQKFCQDPKALIDEPGPVLAECCACDEAKYELSFEGLWSRYTHPKNFPSKPWSARFSDVIGASHTSDYRFWEYDGEASEGLRQVAENGLTRVLESELKNQSEHIRTIIKARGINFPNITSKTFAVFRVDQQHHLMSVVSMVDPSPDWFVGVSGLELCLANCSWIEQKELNLYPVDAGTDDGVSYESADAETSPRDVIRRITTIWPADERSPFYDEAAIDMNPLAKLYLKRQRIYEKDCDRNPNGMESSEEACRVTQWGPWETCSVTCGHGVKLRQRRYKNEKAATRHNCDSVLTDRVICYAENNFVCPPDEVDEKKCPMSDWSDWTPCTKSCGPENRVRDRNFRPKKRRKECKFLYPHIELQQTADCDNPACEEATGGGSGSAADEQTVSEEPEASGDNTEEPAAVEMVDEETQTGDEEAEEAASNLVEVAENRRQVLVGNKKRRKKCVERRYTQWSFWTPCSVSCGSGTKSRSRQIKPEYNGSPDADKDLSLYECQYEAITCEAETKSCEITKELMDVICSQPEQRGECDDGGDDNSLRYYYDKVTGRCVVFHYAGCNGNMNNFRTLQECQATCANYQGPKGVRNYKVKLSSVVTYNLPLVDDDGTFKTKRAKCDDDENPAPEQSNRKKKKKKQNRGDTRSNGDRVDCKMSEWSDWSPCYSCKGYRTISRDILTHPRNGGKLCPVKLIRRQKCHNVLPECDQQSDNGYEHRGLTGADSERHQQQPVSVHCRVSQWSPWSSCTASCGESKRRRIRNIAVAAKGSRGRPCPPLEEIETCPVPDC